MKIPSTLSKPCIVSNGAVPTTVPPFPSSTTLATTTTTTTTTPRPPAPLIDPRLGNLANGEQVNIGAAGDGNINFPRTKRSSRQKRQVTCGGRLQTSVVYPTLSGQARYGDYPWMVFFFYIKNK